MIRSVARILAACALVGVAGACHGGSGVVDLEQAVDVTALHIRAPSGSVRVHSTNNPVGVHGTHMVTGLGGSGRAQVTLDEQGVLTIEAPCAPVLPCQLELNVDVPATLPVVVELGAGSVTTEGVAEADIRVDRGDVSVLDGYTAVVRIGQGSLDARLLGVASLRAVVAEGDVEVAVQPGGWQVRTAAAQLQLSGVQLDRQAPGVLDIHAPSGSVLLRGEQELATL